MQNKAAMNQTYNDEPDVRAVRNQKYKIQVLGGKKKREQFKTAAVQARHDPLLRGERTWDK